MPNITFLWKQRLYLLKSRWFAVCNLHCLPCNLIIFYFSDAFSFRTFSTSPFSTPRLFTLNSAHTFCVINKTKQNRINNLNGENIKIIKEVCKATWFRNVCRVPSWLMFVSIQLYNPFICFGNDDVMPAYIWCAYLLIHSLLYDSFIGAHA